MTYPSANLPPSQSPYASAADIAELWHALTSDQATIVQRWCVKASALLRSRWPSIDARIDAGTLDPENVSTAVAQMVLRVVRNLDGFTSESDGDYNYNLNQTAATGRLAITDDEEALVGFSAFAAGTIRLCTPGLLDCANPCA